MRKLLFISMLAAVSFLLASCGEQAATNNSNAKPANAANNSAAAKPADPAAAEADVKKFMSDLAAALNKNDADAVGKFYADDYTIVANGQVQTKAQRMDAIKSGQTKFENIAFNEMTVKSYGDTAVTSSVVTGKSWMNGKESAANMRSTSVLVKGKDGWKIVSSHTSDAAAAAKTDDAAKPSDGKPAAANTAPANK